MGEVKKRSRRAVPAADCQRFPELCRSDVSINPSYNGLLSLPYEVICRQRIARKKRTYARQLNRELNHMIALKTRALDGIRLDLLFTVD